MVKLLQYLALVLMLLALAPVASIADKTKYSCTILYKHSLNADGSTQKQQLSELDSETFFINKDSGEVAGGTLGALMSSGFAKIFVVDSGSKEQSYKHFWHNNGGVKYTHSGYIEIQEWADGNIKPFMWLEDLIFYS